jgi:hypothetical protein
MSERSAIDPPKGDATAFTAASRKKIMDIVPYESCLEEDLTVAYNQATRLGP